MATTTSPPAPEETKTKNGKETSSDEKVNMKPTATSPPPAEETKPKNDNENSSDESVNTKHTATSPPPTEEKKPKNDNERLAVMIMSTPSPQQHRLRQWKKNEKENSSDDNVNSNNGKATGASSPPKT